MSTIAEEPRLPASVLGKTGLSISRMSLGTWGLGKVGPAAAQIDDDARLASILRYAFDRGVRLLDSAEAYENEERLGRILAQMDVPDDLVIVTKFGHGKGFAADQFRRSAERTLEQLGLEQLPLMLIHDPRNAEDMKTILAPGGALEGLRKLQDEGLLANIGVATGTIDPLFIAVESGEFDVIQFPRLHTLLNQAARDRGLLAAAKERNMGTILAAPFAGNILATGSGPDALYVYQKALPEVNAAVAAMEAVCARKGVPISEAALAFVAQEPLIDTTLMGVTRIEELERNLSVFQSSLTQDDLAEIAAAGAIDPHLIGGPDFAFPFPADRMPTSWL